MRNKQEVVWMNRSKQRKIEESMKLEVLTQDELNLISVRRQELIIGTKTVWAFMDATGKYYLNVNQIEELLELGRYAFLSFLALAGRLMTDRVVGSNGVIPSGHKLRMAWGKGLVTDPAVHYVQDETGRKYRAAELDLVTDFIIDQTIKGSSIALILNKALTKESLQIRCEAVFVGVSPNITDIHEESNRYMERWENARTGTINAHPIFANFCKSNGINGAQAHDYLTYVVTGKTAEQARSGCELITGNPKIGLNYQPSPEELDLIGAIKMKFCTYGKGDWKSRIERAYADLTK
jgi:hypothetical protein